MRYFCWEPIFKDEDNHTGGINKVRFVLYADRNKSQILMVVESLAKNEDIYYAIDAVVEMYGDHFDTMIDTGSITLADTVVLSIASINDHDQWTSQIDYLNSVGA